VRRTIEYAADAGIRGLTLYAFSSDNWRRPTAEVETIFRFLRCYLRLETDQLRERDVRLEVIGRRDRLPKAALREIERTERLRAAGRGLHLRVAIDLHVRRGGDKRLSDL
jgi:undecaprenyl diphosphate synthase